MREPLTPPLMRSNVFTHIGRKVQAPRPSLSLAGSTCTSIHEVELGQCSRFAKRPFAKGPFGKRTAFCAAAVSARQPKAQNAYSPNQPRTKGICTTGMYTMLHDHTKILSAAFDLAPHSKTTTFCLAFCLHPSSMYLTV